MATIFKHDAVEFKEDPGKIEHYRLFTASPRLYSVANSKNLIFDLRMLNPGQYSFPYHFHRHAEELMMVLSGTMTLRSPNGLEVMTKGDLVFFEMGKQALISFTITVQNLVLTWTSEHFWGLMWPNIPIPGK